jgi:hypothetical protein
MNITPEQLKEISERVCEQWYIKLQGCSAQGLTALLFAEFQKLQDSRIAELESEVALNATSDDWLRKHDAALLRSLVEGANGGKHGWINCPELLEMAEELERET